MNVRKILVISIASVLVLFIRNERGIGADVP